MIVLKKLMADHGVTQTELARRTGVPQPSINRFIRGKTKSPSYSTTAKLAKFFNVSVDYLHGAGTVDDVPQSPVEE